VEEGEADLGGEGGLVVGGFWRGKGGSFLAEPERASASLLDVGDGHVESGLLRGCGLLFYIVLHLRSV
jgi:hypothetical protein